MVLGGERAGKSFVSSADLLTRIPWGTEFWIVGPDYYLPRAEFEYVEGHLDTLSAISTTRDVLKPKEGSWILTTKSGQRVITRTSSDVRKLASRSVDGILLVEAGQQDYLAFLKCIGRVAQSRGFLFASGTIESSQEWFSSTFDEWTEEGSHPDGKAYSIPTWENKFEFPGGREDPEILRLERLYRKIPGYFEEKCGAVPAPPLGVIFRQFSYVKHVKELKFDPRIPVYVGVDPSAGGASAYCVVACQFIPDLNKDRTDPIDICHVVDILYIPTADWEVIRPAVQASFWFPYLSGGAIDCEAPDERKRWQMTFGVPLWSQKVPVMEGERRLHSFLAGGPAGAEMGNPVHLYIDAGVDAQPLQEFRKYKSPIDDAASQDSRPSSSSRRREGPDHFLKALWYLLYSRFGPVAAQPMPAPIVRSSVRRLMDAITTRPK